MESVHTHTDNRLGQFSERKFIGDCIKMENVNA